MKTRKFKLIKAFPLSPLLNTIVEFLNEDHQIYDVGAIPELLYSDCANYPEFWRDASNGDIEEEVDAIFEKCTTQDFYSNTEWNEELNIGCCKKEIVRFINKLLDENRFK